MKLLKILLDTYKEEYELNIKEGLIKTFEINQSIGAVKRFLKNKHFNYSRDFIMNKDGNAFHLIMRVAEPDVLNFEDLLKFTNSLGWFPAFLSIEDEKRANNIYTGKWNQSLLKPGQVVNIRFEAKFDEESGFKVPKYIYHVTSEQNLDKIKKFGLAPKSKSKISAHPDRVYVVTKKEDAIDIAQIFSQNSARWKNSSQENWVILTIDTEKIPGDYFKLYKDPNYEEKGFYTLNNIPPYAIEKIDYYKYNNQK
jgi:hypothetical protein